MDRRAGSFHAGWFLSPIRSFRSGTEIVRQDACLGHAILAAGDTRLKYELHSDRHPHEAFVSLTKLGHVLNLLRPAVVAGTKLGRSCDPRLYFQQDKTVKRHVRNVGAGHQQDQANRGQQHKQSKA